MTRAIVYRRLGGPEVLEEITLDSPALGPADLRVRVEAVGVNPIDAKQRAGLRPLPPIQGHRGIGSDAAGVVVEAGADAEGFRPGMAVALSGVQGAYADELVVPAARAVPRPPGVSAEVAAALGVPAATAHQALRSLAVSVGDTLLLHGASGAVGQAVVQFAVAAGARVLGTCSPARADRVRALGAEPVAYGDGLADRARALAPDGVTVALDAVGTDEALRTSLDLVADRARTATIVRGPDAAEWGVRAFAGGSPHPLTATEQRWRAEALPMTLALVAVGAFSVEVGTALPLAEAAEAHRLLAAGGAGKIVLIP